MYDSILTPITDIIFFQESWLNNNNITFPKLEGFHCVRKDRVTPRGIAGVKGGGLLTFIRDCDYLKIDPSLHVLDFGDDVTTEVLQTKLLFFKTSICISNIYIPPIWEGLEGETRVQKFKADNVFAKCLANSPDSLHIIAGDSNSHCSLWDSYILDDIGDDIYEFIIDYGLQCANNGQHTLIRKNDSNRSSPDITLFTEGLSISNWGIVSSVGSSDHIPITYNVFVGDNAECERPRSCPRLTKYSWKKVDWDVFNSDLSDCFQSSDMSTKQESNIHFRSNRFNKCFKKASKKLPRGCRKDPVPWWDDEIDVAILYRNDLADRLIDDTSLHDDWIKACKDVQKLVKNKRQSSYREFASSLNYTKSAAKVAAVFKAIDREPRSTSCVALLTPGGKLLFTDNQKAKAFHSTYAVVCKNKHFYDSAESGFVKDASGKENFVYHMSDDEKKANRKKNITPRDVKAINRDKKVKINSYCESVCSDEQARSFSKPELDAVLDNLNGKSACGSDDIHNFMLKNLNDDNRDELLQLINLSWNLSISPHEWNIGTIIPLPKPGKDKSKLDSFRPVCLTSCVAKVAERMICNRLRFDLESRNILSWFNSGFRFGRNTSDPLLRLVHDAHEGFNSNPSKKTLATLVDLSRAFDKVDHNKLLSEFDKLNIPSCYAKWFRSFLTQRSTRVKYGHSYSSYSRFANGVPQGSVCGPLLFIIYMNSLAILLEPLQSEGLNFGFFADDSTLWHTSGDINESTRVMQSGLDIIQQWSIDYGMPVSVGKNEAILLSHNNDKHTQAPVLYIGNDVVEFKSTVRILGVIIDSKLKFKDHIKKIEEKCAWNLKIMGKISSSSWGPSAIDLHALHTAFSNSNLLYCSPVWSPFLSQKLINKLEVIQNKAARIVTGCVKSTNIEALNLEANFPTVQCRHETAIVIEGERLKRLEHCNPLYKIVMKPVKKSKPRLKFYPHSWKQSYDTSMKKIFYDELEINMKFIENRERTFSNFAVCPWAAVNYDKYIKFYPKVDGGVTSDFDDKDCLAANLETIKSIKDKFGPFFMELWPDGSVKGNIGAGSGLVFTKRFNSSRATEKPSKVYNAAASIGSSFHAEATAINISLLGIIKDFGNDAGWNIENKLLVCTDSQSLVSALKSGPINAKHHLCVSIWKCLLKLRHKFSLIVFQHVFSHCDLERNDMADVQVDQFLDSCTAKIQSKVPIPFKNIKTLLKSRMKHIQLSSLNINQHRYKDVGCGNKYTDLKASSLFTRSDETMLAQLRTGQCRSIGKFRKLVLKTDGVCRWCKTCEESVVHLFNECRQREVMTLRNTLHISCNSLFKAPTKASEYFKKALLLIGNPD